MTVFGLKHYGGPRTKKDWEKYNIHSYKEQNLGIENWYGPYFSAKLPLMTLKEMNAGLKRGHTYRVKSPLRRFFHVLKENARALGRLKWRPSGFKF